MSSSNPIFINAFVQGGSGNSAFHTQVTSNGAPYTIVGLSSTTAYTIVAYYGTTNVYSWSPPAGVYAALYGTSTCNVNSTTTVTPNGSITGINFSFGTSNQINSFSGAVNYTGSKGPVDQCHQIYVVQYPAGTGISGIRSNPSNSSNDNSVNHNGNTFDFVAPDSNHSVCTTQTADLLIFYDAAGVGSNVPQTGDPYVVLGSVSTGTSSTNNSATFGDTNIY